MKNRFIIRNSQAANLKIKNLLKTI